MEEQRKFVAWWAANVSAGYGGNRQVPRSRHLSFKDAEALTGMKQQRVPFFGEINYSAMNREQSHVGVKHYTAT
jgi:hypothetical protein